MRDIVEQLGKGARGMRESIGVQGTGRRYEQMLAGSATAAICAGPENLVISWNKGAELLFGYSREEALGRSLSLIIPERHRLAHEAGLARAVRSGSARMAGHAVEILALHADGHEFPVDLSLSMWTEAGKPMFGALIRDITDRQAARRRLEHLAHCDTLTSLPNRNALHAKMESVIRSAPCALLLLDLDGFKLVNDTLGHSVGDSLLSAVSKRLIAATEARGFLARLGGDEFGLLISERVDPVALDEVAERIFAALENPFEIAGQSIFVETSVGIATAPDDASSVEQLVSSADLALYAAKARGGGVRSFFTRTMQNRSEQRHRIGTELRHAFAKGEFEVWYQPQVRLGTQAIIGFEALLRWRHPEQGLMEPQMFLSTLEDSIIAEQVGDWILDQACAAAARWNRARVGVRMAVNLFPAQLRSDRLFDAVSSTLARHDLSPDQLEVEITENTVLRHDRRSMKSLRKLRSFGVGIAFDDFGTGYASLSLLQKYPLTRIKVDRSFVSCIDEKPSDAVIVGGLIGMAKALGVSVIAEGIETASQEAALIQLGCQEGQGFRYGRPMPADKVLSVCLKQWPPALPPGASDCTP